MPKDHNPSDRVQLRGIGDLMHPGSCALCGSGNCDQGYVDPAIYYDYEGQMYFCVPCMEEMAGVIGMLTVAEVAIMRDLAEGNAKKLKAATEELRIANERLGQYDALFSERLSAIAAASGGSLSSATDSISQDFGEDSGHAVSTSDGRESESQEPVKVGAKSSGPVGASASDKPTFNL